MLIESQSLPEAVIHAALALANLLP